MNSPLPPMGLQALGYSEWGLEVVPLNGKKPFSKPGLYAATTDPNQIIKWWTERPHANIGLRVPAGCLVVDVDPRNGGIADYRRLFPNGSCPYTARTITGSGGLHLYFTLPYSGETNAHFGKGIDLQGRKRLTVLPPSIHPKTHRAYKWWPFLPPEQWAPLPEWCLPHVYKVPDTKPKVPEHIRRHYMKQSKDPGAGLIRTVVEAQEGNRNHALNWAAWTAAKDGLDIKQELINAAITAGLPEVEATSTATSGTRAGERARGNGEVA
ncbi:bifunctional DNA primase/polymerase [Corynebacterium glucuronolyticum]|uniref:Bifunctional DNA primase/polymerase n=2 Tax=Corynebacterium glucuronolyticum TaxID=39791 RepID=A0AAX1L809_9CORY|nr:bifunctional DNA primase/polymerase [Corynebacterium glucuronolyticum]QRP70132.1 bifunctional DNA primase/polymerase [Corynebacterium glucuronolyticum]